MASEQSCQCPMRVPSNVIVVDEFATREASEEVRQRQSVRSRQREASAWCDQDANCFEKAAWIVDVLEELARHDELRRLESEFDQLVVARALCGVGSEGMLARKRDSFLVVVD